MGRLGVSADGGGAEVHASSRTEGLEGRRAHLLGFRAADGELLARARRTASSRRAWQMAGAADGEGDGGGAKNRQPDGVMFGGAFGDLCLRLQMDWGRRGGRL